MICVARKSAAQAFMPKTMGTFILALGVTGVSPGASGGINTAAGIATGRTVDVQADVRPT